MVPQKPALSHVNVADQFNTNMYKLMDVGTNITTLLLLLVLPLLLLLRLLLFVLSYRERTGQLVKYNVIYNVKYNLVLFLKM